MTRIGSPALAVAALLFCIYFANVAAGAFAQASFLGDVSEMLTLFGASVAFVIGVLGREAAAKDRKARAPSD